MGKPLDLHERALRLLSVRPRSRRELERRLVGAGFEPTEVREELERLEAVGLVDDRAFAQQVLEHELRVRGSGRRAIVSRLAAKGVDRATIESTLADLPAEADEDRAGELALGRLPRLAGLPREQAYARLTGFLARRGYDADVARRAARRALEVGSEP